ncbi:hypothetical protein V2S66_09025 [Streptomyces sp. V4-01]|uniref:Lipoprotein n=1 Tax=Actinacidiphila polyblastidii TaxID=3110430 RepID=A0ABU7P8G4_9ACTN|nr:hypothetical protein [Streptomyces sp. V4-01]
MKHTTAVAVLVTALSAAALAALTGCGGAAGGDAKPRASDGAGATPVQALPSAPDPRSIKVPSAAAPAGASAGPAPTGPTADLSPVDAWTRAAATMAGQKSASLTLDIRNQDGGSVHAVSSVADDGDCVGHFTEGGGRGEVIHVGQKEYLRGDARLWAWEDRQEGLPGSDTALFVGRWVAGPLAQLGAFDVDAMCSLPEAVGNVTADFSGLKQVRGPFTVAGRQAVSLTQTGSTDSITLYIPMTGPAVVLKAVQRGDATVTTTFADLGRPVRAKAPANALGGS